MVVAIIAILAALLLPSLKSARDSARSASCMNNLRQIGTAIHLYANDFEGNVPEPVVHKNSKYPTACGQWLHMDGEWIGFGHLYDSAYMRDPKVFFCPGNDSTKYGGYSSKLASGENGWLKSNGAINTNSNVRCSYHYRYVYDVFNKVPPSLEAGSVTATDGSTYKIYNAKLDLVTKLVPAAAWDVNGVDDSFNPRYHPGGYNVLFYDGSVAKLSAAKWPDFPDNLTGYQSFSVVADKSGR